MNKVIRFFEKLGEIGNHPFAALSTLFENDRTAGYGMGAVAALAFTSLLLPLAGNSGFSWITVVLTYIFIIGICGLLYTILPTWEEARGDISFRKSLKYLKWFGIFVLVVALSMAWFLRIGPPALLFITTIIIIYWVAPQIHEHILNRMKMEK